jgi:hypothetical protein
MSENFSMFLFARPSFTEGISRVIDFGNTLSEYNKSLDGPQADRLSLQSDIKTLRSDLEYARQQIKLELSTGIEQVG